MRILCLGDELLGDDSVATIVGRHIRQLLPPDVEIEVLPESSFDFPIHIVNTPSLVVVEAVQTGEAPPGTVHLLDQDDLASPVMLSTRYNELKEAVELARSLHLMTPDKIVLLAIEVGNLQGAHAEMLPAVRAAAPVVAEMIEEMLPQWT